MQKTENLLALVSKAKRQRLRAEKTFREKEIRNHVFYYGLDHELAYWQFRFSQPDAEAYEYQLIRETALHLALKDYAVLHPKGFAIIDDYYFHGRITFTELGKLHGISRQAATKSLRKHICNLRPLVEAYIRVLTADIVS